MRRREFTTRLSSAPTWSQTALVEQPNRIRSVGALQTTAKSDLQGQARNAALPQGLQQLGWIEGRDLYIETSRDAANTATTVLVGGAAPRCSSNSPRVSIHQTIAVLTTRGSALRGRELG